MLFIQTFFICGKVNYTRINFELFGKTNYKASSFKLPHIYRDICFIFFSRMQVLK